MKILFKKIKSEKKKKNKNIDKIKPLEIELSKIKYANNPNKLLSQLKEFKKIHVVNKKLYEMKQEVLGDYASEFEEVGYLKTGDQIRQTFIRFRNISDYEAYIKSIDEGFDAEEAIFKGYIYKVDTPQFNLVNRSQHGNGCDFKQQIIE